MYKTGYAQEIITPPVGVGLAGYFSQRPNQGMLDDLYVKVILFQEGDQTFGFMTFDLCSLKQVLFNALEQEIRQECGQEILDGLIISATHTHTGPLFPNDLEQQDENTKTAFRLTVQAAVRALKRARMNLLPCTLEVGSVYNNPFAFVRRYWMTNGEIMTNPGYCNPNVVKPEGNFDRTIGILAVKQQGRLVALICNIANHGDTIGGNLVSADWYGRFAQEIQYRLKASIPVIVVDDASGNLNHFDLNQNVRQTSYDNSTRIGRGYASIVLDAMNTLEPIADEPVTITNGIAVIPHRMVTDQEVRNAQEILEAKELPVPKEPTGLSPKNPGLMKAFAQRVVDCRKFSTPSHQGRMTVIRLGNTLAFASLPGEPFNDIGSAIRKQSPTKYTFVVELAQFEVGYIPMTDCFKHGGYEVQPNVNSAAPEAAEALIKTSLALF